MGKSLESIWVQSKEEKGLKVRYLNWDHRTKYFKINSYSPDKTRLIGILDNGEEFDYSLFSEHWVLYESEMEDAVKAV